MKPYAYAVIQGVDGMENVSLQFDHPEMCGQKYKDAIPLFANLQKELTDEEIWEIGKNYCAIKNHYVTDFAKAILKKAQEK